MPISYEFNESTFAAWVGTEIFNHIAADPDDELIALPVVPTLTNEADWGYDLSIKSRWALIFLQFKLPVWVYGSNGGQRWRWGGPYFRFDVKTQTTSNGQEQHNTLVDLANDRRPGAGFVYYCAPVFRTEAEFLGHVQASTVTENSVFPSPLALGRVAPNAVHCYTYVDPSEVVPFSEPLPESPASVSTMLDTVGEGVRAGETMPLGQFLTSAGSVLGEITGVDLNDSAPPLMAVATISSVLSLQPILLRTKG